MVLALLAVLIAPHFIDWSAYRADFEREASRILGRPVAVHGTASVQILPFPSVTFTDVEVADGRSQPLLKIAKFRMDAELAPYLSGEIRIFSMRLDQPKLRLTIDRDGRLTMPVAGGTLPTNATVVLEDVTVADGEIVVENQPAETKLILGSLDGTFAATSLKGPVSGSGSFLAKGRPFDFQIAAGTPNSEAHLPLKLTVEDETLAVSASADGLVAFKNGVPRFEGDVRSASLPRSAKPAGTDGEANRPQPRLQGDVPVFALTAKGVAEPELASLEDIRLSVGGAEKPYVLTGSARLTGGLVPDFDLDLAGEQLDIDAVASDTKARGSPSFVQRLEAARALIARVPRPAVAGRARLSLPVVVAGDTTLREFSVEASPLPAGWTIRQFEAELPGRTRVEATGVLDVAAALAFRGSLLLAARQPSGFAEWLSGSVDPAIRSLSQAGFSASVDLSSDKQMFHDLEVNVGGDTLAGSLERDGSTNARSINADLHGGKIDLDALVALSRLFTGEADSLAEARDGRLRLVAGPITLHGVAANKVDTDIAFDGTVLTIDHARISGLAGSDLSARGTLAGLPSDPSGRVEFSLDSRQPDELLALLAERLPSNFVLERLRARSPTLAPLRLAGLFHTVPGAAGERPTLDADLKGRAAGTEVSVTMRLPNPTYGTASLGAFDLGLALGSENGTELLRQLGIDALPMSVPAPLTFDASFVSDAAGTIETRAALAAPGSRLAAEGTIGASADGVRKAQLGISGRSDDLAPWLVATGETLGADPATSLPATLGGTLRYDDGNLALTEVEGSVGPIDLSADLEKPAGAPIAGRLFLSELSLPWLASLVYGQPVLEPSRPEAWNGAAFRRSVLPPIALSLDLTMDQLHLGGAAAMGDVSARLQSSADEAALEDLRGTLGGGYATGMLRFENANGVGAFSAEGDLQGLDLAEIASNGFALPTEDDVATERGESAIDGTLDAKLRLGASGQSMTALVSAMTGAGNVKLENASLKGIATAMLPELLRLTDADARKTNLTAADVTAMLNRLESEARYPIASAMAEFSVAGGVARFSPVRITKPGETLTAEGAIDLSRFTADASLRLDLDPGMDAVKGAAPMVSYSLSGTLAAPRLTPDVQALANYLSVRALEREQARVEAIQSALQEKLRLRREVRFYRWVAARQAEESVEDIRSENLRRSEALQADRARRAEEERAAAAREERARLERERALEHERAEAARRSAEPAPPVDDLDLELAPPITLPPPPAASNLPGVRTPQPF